MDQTVIIELARLTAIVSVIIVVAATAIIVTGAIKAPETAASVILAVRPGSVVRMVTVISIVVVIFGLRVMDKISADAAISSLSGIAGYILGGSERHRQRDSRDTSGPDASK
jgi:hypothetical protein